MNPDRSASQAAHCLPRLAELSAAVERYDGAAPLDEATWRTLRHDPAAAAAWLVVSSSDPLRPDPPTDRAGLHFAPLLPDEPWAGAALRIRDEIHLLVAPESRGLGIARMLLDELLEGIPTELPLTAWSHGGHPAAGRLARHTGFRPVRDLWVLRRDAGEALPDLPDVEGVRLLGFSDTWREEVLRVNAAAFSDHPEQGGMDAADLAQRMAEPWFEPDGLLLAVDPDVPAGGPESLLGFHWTKRHDPETGEVYVVAVDPRAQGRGLGKLLTLAGLHHLRRAGVRHLHLYVESDNAAALATYLGLGFTHAPADTHVQYRRGGVTSGHASPAPESPIAPGDH